VRSGSHPCNLSLGAALLTHDGEAKTEAWVRGMVANFAWAPKGGDTDPMRAVAAGECGVALANSYYVARMMGSTKTEDVRDMAALTVVWPNQKTWGTHVNVSGSGVIKTAPNQVNAVKFLEYLASDSAQTCFADGNNEWPVVSTATVKNPALDEVGPLKADALPIDKWAPNMAAAQKVFDQRRLALNRSAPAARPACAACVVYRSFAICRQRITSSSSPTATIASDAVEASARRSSDVSM
jgi:iron(III) transport system substrate-binding protein